MVKILIVLIIMVLSSISEAQVTPAIKQKGNNVGPPGLSNIGVLPCVATAADPVYIEGNQVSCSVRLNGLMRTDTAAGGGGGTSSTFGAAFPATGTAAGWFDGTNMQGARVFDVDTGVGTQYVAGSSLRCSAAGGSTECLPATAIDADAIANQTSTYIHGMSYMYNGATWDRVRGTIAGGLLMQVSNATLAVTQSGTWNINNISGVISLPTGASTEATLATRLADATFTGRFPVAYVDADTIANQTTTAIHGQMYGYNGATWDRLRSSIANGLVVDVSRVQGNVAVTNAGLTNLDVLLSTRLADATFTGRINTLGQKAMAASTPVVLASDQASIPVAATVSNAFLLDATFTGRFAAAFVDADTIANQTTTAVHGMGYMYNGATWDRMRGSIAAGLLVNVSNASLAVTGTFFQATQPVSIAGTVNVQGTKSNNSVIPGVNNEGVLPCIANAIAPTWTEGNQVGCSTDLSGNERATTIPQPQSVNIQTYVGYTTSSVVLLNTSTIRQTYLITNLASSSMCISLAATSSLNTCTKVIKTGDSWVTPDTVTYRGNISGRWFSSGIGEAIITDIPGG